MKQYEEYNEIYNTKYTKAIEIASSLSSRIKSKQIDINDIIEWCAKCEVDEIRSAPEWFLFKAVPLEVKHEQALVPCNLYRLLDVHDNLGKKLPYYYNGTYINMDSKYKYKVIFINYYGLPIDPDGRPLIVKGHEKACEYYCMKMLFEEDYYLGHIDQNRWEMILGEYSDGLMRAYNNYKNLSRNDINEIIMIHGNMIPKIGGMPNYRID